MELRWQGDQILRENRTLAVIQPLGDGFLFAHLPAIHVIRNARDHGNWATTPTFADARHDRGKDSAAWPAAVSPAGQGEQVRGMRTHLRPFLVGSGKFRILKSRRPSTAAFL